MPCESEVNRSRAPNRERLLKQEIEAALIDFHVPISRWRILAAKLGVMAARGAARSALDQARQILEQVRAAATAVEALKEILSSTAAGDSRYLDKVRSLRQLEAQLLSIIKSLEIAAMQERPRDRLHSIQHWDLSQLTCLPNASNLTGAAVSRDGHRAS